MNTWKKHLVLPIKPKSTNILCQWKHLMKKQHETGNCDSKSSFLIWIYLCKVSLDGCSSVSRAGGLVSASLRWNWSTRGSILEKDTEPQNCFWCAVGTACAISKGPGTSWRLIQLTLAFAHGQLDLAPEANPDRNRSGNVPTTLTEK